ISGGASLYGDIITYNSTGVLLKLDNASLDGTRLALPSWDTHLALTVDVGNITSNGTYSLVEAASFSSFGGITLTAGESNKKLNLNKSVTIGEITYSLATQTTGEKQTLALTVSGFVINDTKAPVLTGIVQAEQGDGPIVTLTWNEATDNMGVTGYELRWDGEIIQVGQTSFTLENITEGSHTVQVRAFDTAGNYSEWTTEQNVEIIIDKVAPEITSFAMEITQNDAMLVSLTFNKPLALLQYSWNGGDWQVMEGTQLTMHEDGALRFRLTDLAGNVTVSDEYTLDSNPVITDIQCQALQNGGVLVDWSNDNATQLTNSYDLELSNGGACARLNGIKATGVECLNATASDVSLSVKPDFSGKWAQLENPIAAMPASGTCLITGTDDGRPELMLAGGSSTWSNEYRARHIGAGAWMGTREFIALEGKNKLDDVFAGSNDASILLLTDDDNGDALFVDDIYTAFPNGLEAQARLARINEIRAGAGDDIVDLTSQRYEYIGYGVTVRGGLGDDVIWTNKGSNLLFGDAGNDRLVGASNNDILVGGSGNDIMHGGGGDDVFTFCDSWGQDSVEQLATGTITLWFKEGDNANWNSETLTYADGDNSVTVIGIGLESITLKFGDDGNAQYQNLLAAGAFEDATNEKIFENHGLLA
ncbi:MAG: hypothetical protein IJS08_03970, partial [Victivallales bacterium]|nr:hypothetical protein [Victivallales bacterium]